MKLHLKSNEKIAKSVPTAKVLSRIGSRVGTVDDLIWKNRDFYNDIFVKKFDWVVKGIWLEHQYLYGGISRGLPRAEGFMRNKVYGYFMRDLVGVSQKLLTDDFFFTAVSSYIPGFFPTLYDHNPFEEPEYFKFPYKNIYISHLTFVYQCEERIEMLEYAEKVSMPYGEFRDWAVNHVSETNPKGYEISFWHNSTYIKRIKK